MSEPLKVQGILHRVGDVQEISERFKKRDFVIVTEEEYPQFLQFQCAQDRVKLVEGLNPGDKLEIFFNLRGNEYQKDTSSPIRVFNTLDCWRINKLYDSPEGSNEAPTEDDTDLPF